MDITTRTVGNCVILDCSGKFTLGLGIMNARDAVCEAIKGSPKRIVLNLERVEYLDSSGIGELVSCLTHVQKQGGQLVLLNLPRNVRELLMITKLISVF